MGTKLELRSLRTSLAVQWLRLHLPKQRVCVGFILGQGAKIPHALQPENQNMWQMFCLKMIHIQKKKTLKRERMNSGLLTPNPVSVIISLEEG